VSVPMSAPPPAGMVWIPGGRFLMGSDHHYPEPAARMPQPIDTGTPHLGFRCILRA
jgi:formylglycine-generating enzyme required for sulfatase activity